MSRSCRPCASTFACSTIRGEEIELQEDDDDDEIVYTDSGRENLVTDENEVLSSGYGIDADSEAKQGLDALKRSSASTMTRKRKTPSRSARMTSPMRPRTKNKEEADDEQ